MYERWVLNNGVAHVYLDSEVPLWKPWLVTVEIFIDGRNGPMRLTKRYWRRASAVAEMHAVTSAFVEAVGGAR
jgi:hypothetical protein